MPQSTAEADARRPVRVFLLDDHEVVRRGVRDLLEVEPGLEVVGEASTAEQALAGFPRRARTLRCWTYDCRTGTGSPSAASCARAFPDWCA